MRMLFAAILFMTLAASIDRSAAAEYAWCAQYGSFGATNCGFVSQQQCLLTISGAGGLCYPNPAYTGSTVPQSGRSRRHRG